MDLTTITTTIAALVAGAVGVLIAIRPVVKTLRNAAEKFTPTWEVDDEFFAGMEQGVEQALAALEAFGYDRDELEEALEVDGTLVDAEEEEEAE